MSTKSQVLLANVRSKARKAAMPAHQRRRLSKQQKVLRYAAASKGPKTISGKVFLAIKEEKELDVGNIIDYVYARWGEKLEPKQVHSAVQYLRRQNKIEEYTHTYVL